MGTLLLMLPISSVSGESCGLMTALFTATSATCVTGLILVDTLTQFTLFGQVVILLLIQLGGLGFMSVIFLLASLVRKRMSLSQRLMMVSAFNLNDMHDVARLVGNAFRLTFVLEAMGAKNAPALEGLAGEGLLPEKAAKALSRLALLYDRPAPALAALEPLAENQRMAAALAELKELCALMEQRGLAEHLRLDFSIANDMNYYSGAVFRGFVPGLAAGVLAGGRYDHLLHRMGRQGGAIGFAVYLDQLERFGAPAQDEVDVLVLYDDSVSAARVAAETDALVAVGQTVRAERQKPEAGYKRLLDLRKEGGGE